MSTFTAWLILSAALLAGYLLGSVNTSIIISKYLGADIRNHGSGNAGATNMLRTYGKRFGILVLASDALKGVLAVALGMLAEYLLAKYTNAPSAAGISYIKYLAAIGVMLGHIYPIFFGLRGGKGIATAGAAMLMLDWRTGLITLIIALGVMALTRYVSLGSVIAGLCYPALTAVFVFAVDRSANLAALLTSLILGGVAVYRHKDNIRRLIAGTETKLGSRKPPDTGQTTDGSPGGRLK